MDKHRGWIYAALVLLVLSQLYAFKELTAVFALFALGFAVVAPLVALCWGIQKAWETAIDRIIK